MSQPKTVSETAGALKEALTDYIQATYHVSSPQLIRQRERLLERPGTVAQRPFLESTPRYEVGAPLAQLGLPPNATRLLTSMSDAGLIHDPPYLHQGQALRGALVDDKSLIVTTGTGSGKTECFMLPILGRLAEQAALGGLLSWGSRSAVKALVLYPMNALVNDQLGRLRRYFGHETVTSLFAEWAGRPARFARYTSRTPYPGVRDSKKDSRHLRPIFEGHYIKLLEEADVGDEAAATLIKQLKAAGRWPAKPDLRAWFKRKGAHWADRCVARPEDVELFTRHEVQREPPDVLVTNYSMLEYMMLRPIERPIFDQTAAWFEDHPDERFTLVLDEAHLYRGAAGSEVALLIRRLRARLGLTSERLQVICTSASFQDPEAARTFAAQLTGKRAADFAPALTGSLRRAPDPADGTVEEARLLGGLDMQGLYAARGEARVSFVAPLLKARDVSGGGPLHEQLYEALSGFRPLSKLINETMGDAKALDALGELIFPGVERAAAERAVANLAALATLAKPARGAPGLLPCRLHAFFRGLPGLWVCLDPHCPELLEDERGGPCGRLYAQPRAQCRCGSAVLELFTCRSCGAAHARAYAEDPRSPDRLFAEPGRPLRADERPLSPVDLLLEEPPPAGAERCELSLATGQIVDARWRGPSRPAWRTTPKPPSDGSDGSESAAAGPGQFRPCAICGDKHSAGRSSVQDHQTKGDQPFQTLVTRQIEVQPPSDKEPTEFARLRGRKSLLFSDSRQVAARLAPNLQEFSVRDALRPLLVSGHRALMVISEREEAGKCARRLKLHTLNNGAYLWLLIGAEVLHAQLPARLQPARSEEAREQIRAALEGDVDALFELRDIVAPPRLCELLNSVLLSRGYGLADLAIASIEPTDKAWARLSLPDLGPFKDDKAKRAIVAAWLRFARGLTWKQMPSDERPDEFNGVQVLRGSLGPALQKDFKRSWHPTLHRHLVDWAPRAGALQVVSAVDWTHCDRCKRAQPALVREGGHLCAFCGSDDVRSLDPATDPVFQARKGYYRRPTERALSDGEAPLQVVAAEHTAQINAAQQGEAFSHAERYELLFQDIDARGLLTGEGRQISSAVDVLSCTTTMEVGIDIGALSAVALRNMPPSRANYQQRAGRAGRRADSVATVIAFADNESHDAHYYNDAAAMVSGDVRDPRLTMDNRGIARRHVLADLLQRYHRHALPRLPDDKQPQLFSVLGTAVGFKRGTQPPLSLAGFNRWLRGALVVLRAEIDGWLPCEISPPDRAWLLDELGNWPTRDLEAALVDVDPEDDREGPTDDAEQAPDSVEAPFEVGAPRASKSGVDPEERLLDLLFERAVLPKYAFPTDVATLHVFSRRSRPRRPLYQYTPQQGMTKALSQYAPGREVWIDSRKWVSGALYGPHDALQRAWDRQKRYLECAACGFSDVMPSTPSDAAVPCPACGAGELAAAPEAHRWLRPPGFAHPHDRPPGERADGPVVRSYATRARLTAPAGSDGGREVHPRVRGWAMHQPMLVTNRGPRNQGYTLCVECGRITPSALPRAPTSFGSAHERPSPPRRRCHGEPVDGVVLGTSFRTDVALFEIRAPEVAPLHPHPHLSPQTVVALRTLAEALALAACRHEALNLEPGEMAANFRPALSEDGHAGRAFHVYLYDTLPGGAGFARAALDLGEDLWRATLALLEACPSGCEASCYQCLRSFSNRLDHPALDRHVAASLLRAVLDDAPLSLPAERVRLRTAALASEIERVAPEVRVSLDAPLPGRPELIAPILVERGDRQVAVDLSHPLAPGRAPLTAAGEALWRSSLPDGCALELPSELQAQMDPPRVCDEILRHLSAP